MGLGLTLSRPIVHGVTSEGSLSPSRVIVAAQPSPSSFLITRAVQPCFFHIRGSVVSSTVSSSMPPSIVDGGDSREVPSRLALPPSRARRTARAVDRRRLPQSRLLRRRLAPRDRPVPAGLPGRL